MGTRWGYNINLAFGQVPDKSYNCDSLQFSFSSSFLSESEDSYSQSTFYVLNVMDKVIGDRMLWSAF